MKRWHVIIFFCFILLISISTHGYGAADRVVVVVNHEVITKAELDAHISLLRMQMGEDGWRQFRMTAAKALEALIEDRLILQEARREGIDVDERSVESRFERMREGYKTDEVFSDMLIQQGLSIDELMRRIREQMLVELFISRKIRSRIFISPRMVSDFYKYNIEEFNLPDRVEVEDIFVDNKSLAEDIYAKLKLGLDFNSVKERYSQKEGLSGIVKKGEFRKEIDDVIFSLAEGAFSAPIQIENTGYFIFFIRRKYPANEKRELIEVQDRIRNVLSEREFQRKLSILLDKLKRESYIVIKDE